MLAILAFKPQLLTIQNIIFQFIDSTNLAPIKSLSFQKYFCEFEKVKFTRLLCFQTCNSQLPVGLELNKDLAAVLGLQDPLIVTAAFKGTINKLMFLSNP